MMKKSVLVLLLICFMTVMLCGCAKSFTYSYYIDTAGAVHNDYRFEYDATAEDADVVKTETKRVFNELVEQNSWESISVLDESTAGVMELRVTYPSVADYYIALGRTGKEVDPPQEKENKGILVAYKNTSFDYYSDAFVEKARLILGDGYEDVTFAGCDFYYVYGTRYKSTTSNADSVKEENGLYYHTWKLAPDEDQEIVITQFFLNDVLIYVVIICIFVLSLAAIFVIIVVSNKKYKEKFRSVVPDQGVTSEKDE